MTLGQDTEFREMAVSLDESCLEIEEALGEWRGSLEQFSSRRSSTYPHILRQGPGAHNRGCILALHEPIVNC